MPTSHAILENLATIANELIPLALFWHVAVLVAVGALLYGWGPSKRRAAMLLLAPLASSAAVAFVYGNPFNGAVLSLLVAVFAAVAWRLPPEKATLPGGWPVVVGGAMVAFGLFYPHFLETKLVGMYLAAAPMGLLPCPTLGFLVGVTLVTGGFGSRAWSIVLAAAGLFYGVFGLVKLGVWLDVALAAGSALLVVAALLPRGRGRAAIYRNNERTSLPR